MSALLRRLPRPLEAGRRTLVFAWIIGSIPWIPPTVPLAAQLWEPADVQTTIGRLDGSGPDVFGRVRTTEVDAAGNVYVLDEQTSGIHVFDPDGDHIASYRRSGQGPRELRGIRGSDLDSEGILHVADAGNGRISTFRLEGDSLAFRGVTTLRFAPEDVCVLGGRRYVLHQPGPPGEPTISEIDGDGRVIRRFASPEEGQGGAQRRELGPTPHLLNWGYIACDEATRTIVKFNWFVPVVRAYDPEGEELWTTWLDDYVPWRITLNSRDRCCSYRPDPDEDGSHSGRAVATDDAGHVFLGVQIDGPRWAFQRHELIVLDASSGRLAERHPAVGIVGSVGEGRLFTFGEDPFPQVRVFGTR